MSVGLNISQAKLWVDRLAPHHNTRSALNYSLAMKPIKYVFNKILYKAFVTGSG